MGDQRWGYESRLARRRGSPKGLPLRVGGQACAETMAQGGDGAEEGMMGEVGQVMGEEEKTA